MDEAPLKEFGWNEKAIADWEKNHKLGDGWHIIGGGYRKKDGKPYVLLECDNRCVWCYGLNCAGNGQYFVTMAEANWFAKENNWV